MVSLKVFVFLLIPNLIQTQLASISIRILSLDLEEVDSFKMELRIRLTLQQFLEQNLLSINSIQVPPLRVLNSRHFETMDSSNWTVEIENQFVQTKTVAVRLGCLMDFTTYPFDHQRCPIELGFSSSELPTPSIVYLFKDDKLTTITTEESKISRNRIKIDHWQTYVSLFRIIGAFVDQSHEEVKNNSGDGSSMTIVLHIRRYWSAYFGSYYLAISAFVFVSFLTLWLVYPKISVVINFLNIILLGLFLILHRHNMDIPRLHYVTAMSIYSVTCLVFATMVLLVNVYVLYYIRTEEEDDEDKAKRRRAHDLNIRNDLKYIPSSHGNPNESGMGQRSHSRIISGPLPPSESDLDLTFSNKPNNGQPPKAWTIVKRKLMDRIRRNSHWTLLVIFLLFNIVYWVTLLCVHYLQ